VTTDYRDKLREIHTFPSLVKFLRDDLDWPIDSTGDFEDITFDYTAAELGIDAASAAKIDEIKQLRRLAANQPWGIFFIKFEPKQLPVVALRRILNALAVKRRAMASDAEQKKWATDDLLFISNYGEDEERRISFAHFSQDPFHDRLPTLKVLAWDDLDTPLHLDYTANTLVERLAWPASEDEWDDETWRERWSSAFELRNREVITTSKNLAVSLAALARTLRDRIKTVLAIETEDGPVTGLMKAFQTALVHDLDADTFADMYAQTIAYGLLTARVTNPKANSALGVAVLTPVTNPFLKELLETFLGAGGKAGGIDFDELGVSDVVELLDDANMEAVVRDFGDKNPQEDPVIHFYELFLKEYDAKKRMQRGVFYTPRPVVSYIVRSVHELLQTEFGLADGLADTATWGEMVERDAGLTIPDGLKPTERFVTVLDPATGTGTFLVEAIDVIHGTLVEKWKRDGHVEKEILDLWNDYVPAHLLPRLHGYELLMAPYAIAHLKIGLKLHETGYRFGSDERARVYLTNALEPAEDFSDRLAFDVPALAHEAQAVNAIKRQGRFTVVIGNPPYSNFGQLNRIPWILSLLDDYKRGLGEKKLNLDDDFLKFVRLSQYLVDTAGAGVWGMITNNTYLNGLTHRQVRQSLLRTFSWLRFLNLHGDQRKKERAPDGSRDENVFDIMQGVAIAIGARHLKSRQEAEVAYADLWGTRNAKYGQLLTLALSQEFAPVSPQAPHLFFASSGEEQATAEYDSWWSLTNICAGISGIETKRDHFAIDRERSVLERRIRDFVDGDYSDEDRKERFGLRDNEWVVSDAVEKLRSDRSWESQFVPCLYRPFDRAWIVYDGTILARDRGPLMAGMTRVNLGIVAARQSKESFAVLATDCVCTHKIVTVYDRSFVFPLYLYTGDSRATLQLTGLTGRVSGLSDDFVKDIQKAVGLRWEAGGAGNLSDSFGPEDIFRYAYAVFYSPGYRNRYAERLRVDFPRLPLTVQTDLFRALVSRGSELIDLHLLNSPKLERPLSRYIGGANPAVDHIKYANDTVWLDKAESSGFADVPLDVWNFHIGYQVCEKWLKDRKGRALSANDIAHYQKMVVALSETIRVMQEIDAVIDVHGGWPDAFAASESAAVA
jgi:predicted helicase